MFEVINMDVYGHIILIYLINGNTLQMSFISHIKKKYTKHF